MKLLAHLIYLLNEQGVGNTFYLSPIIKKILDNHYILLKPIPTDLTTTILRTWK